MQESHTLWGRLIRFGFRLLYNEMAWSYDLVSWVVSLGEWRNWQAAALPFLVGDRVLEIAHGPGHMLLRLAEQHSEVVGIDLSEAMSRQARRRLVNAQVIAPVMQASVQAVPFADGYFDSILSTFPTAFILEVETLTELRRVLRENGRLVVVPEGHLTGAGPIQTILDWLFKATGQRSKATASEQQIWHAFSSRFAEAGFLTEIQQLDLGKSSVTILVGEKQAGLPNN